MKELFGDFGDISFVDFELKQEKGFIRFKESTSADKALKEFSGGLGGKAPKLSILSGDEEKDYWDSIRNSQQKNRKSKGRKKGQRRRRK